ncbi:MAG TPA: hypothetical protein VH016_09455 [Actinomycetota bacterium]|nr:hypothetical protein [Actinomycetota bacterium]
MTERYGSGYGEEGSQRPSGRGAVTERLAGQDQVNEIDLTDETTERESSGAFEPADTDRTGPSNIFDVDERAKQEDQNPTGYEPSVADPDADPDGPRGETVVTEPGQPREEPDTEAADAEAAEVPPAPVAEPPAETPADAPAATEAPAAADAPALLGSLDAGEIRNRFLDIQAGFIDEPRQAVEEAGRFVDDLLRQVAEALQQQRGQLAGATGEGSTEDLRLALRAYRQFVDRLLGLAS